MRVLFQSGHTISSVLSSCLQQGLRYVLKRGIWVAEMEDKHTFQHPRNWLWQSRWKSVSLWSWQVDTIFSHQLTTPQYAISPCCCPSLSCGCCILHLCWWVWTSAGSLICFHLPQKLAQQLTFFLLRKLWWNASGTLMLLAASVLIPPTPRTMLDLAQILPWTVWLWPQLLLCVACSPNSGNYTIWKNISGVITNTGFRLCQELADKFYEACKELGVQLENGTCDKLGNQWKTREDFWANGPFNHYFEPVVGSENCFNANDFPATWTTTFPQTTTSTQPTTSVGPTTTDEDAQDSLAWPLQHFHFLIVALFTPFLM